MRFALVQMSVTMDKEENLRTAARFVADAAAQGAQLVVLPEMFFCPYANRYFPLYAEERGGPAYRALSDMARQNGVTLAAGSMPEREDGRLFNTAFVFDSQGREIARHRKAHLFDIDVEGGQRFMESEVFTPGDCATTFTAGGVRLGLCVCFDIRFPELFRRMALDGAQAVLVPAAFNMTTGPMHWDLSFRMRAVDNQLFTLGAAPARDEKGCYVSYAHSIACSPWGEVLARAGAGQELLLLDIDFAEVQRVRRQLPLLSARRPEIY